MHEDEAFKKYFNAYLFERMNQDGWADDALSEAAKVARGTVTNAKNGSQQPYAPTRTKLLHAIDGVLDDGSVDLSGFREYIQEKQTESADPTESEFREDEESHESVSEKREFPTENLNRGKGFPPRRSAFLDRLAKSYFPHSVNYAIPLLFIPIFWNFNSLSAGLADLVKFNCLSAAYDIKYTTPSRETVIDGCLSLERNSRLFLLCLVGACFHIMSANRKTMFHLAAIYLFLYLVFALYIDFIGSIHQAIGDAGIFLISLENIVAANLAVVVISIAISLMLSVRTSERPRGLWMIFLTPIGVATGNSLVFLFLSATSKIFHPTWLELARRGVFDFMSTYLVFVSVAASVAFVAFVVRRAVRRLTG